MAFPNSNVIISASRDATVRLWKLVSSPPPTYDYTIAAHGQAFINSLAYLPPTAEYPEGLVLSGGQDTIIEARQPSKSSADNADAMLLGHGHNICALDVSPGSEYIVSGSWDSTARLWRVGKWEPEVVFEGHQGSVWAVLAYDRNTVITGTYALEGIWKVSGLKFILTTRVGCADQMIRIFDTSGKLLGSIKNSNDVVRALCKLPESHPSGAHFASASNDGVIRLYTLKGDLVASLHGHESFVYSLAVLPSGELVSSGEDRTVRIWQGTQCVQTITHPAISVWSVAACRETGDIVSGASDRVTRVFTRSPHRQAAPEAIQQFEQAVKESAIPAEQVGKINKEQLPGPEFLKEKSGTKEGQVQMIRELDGSVTAHTWSSATHEWIAVGTVVDSAGSSGRKTEYLGQDYDYVFDVDIEDGKPPLKLPYNVSQNPYEAATKFIGDNELPMSYLDQVANFITQNTQGATLGQSEQSGADAWGSERRYRPGDAASTNEAAIPTPEPRPRVLPQKTYLSIRSANTKIIAKKLQELNEKILAEGDKSIALNSTEVEAVVAVCAQLENTQKITDSSIVEFGLPLIFNIATKWPVANRLPGLDLLRLLASATPMTATVDYDGADLVTGVLSSGVFDASLNVNNAMLAVRTFANLFETEAGRKLAIQNFDQLLAGVKSALANVGSTPNRNLTIAVATLYINFAVYLTSEGRAQSPEAAEQGLGLLDALTKILSSEKDSEAVYRGLVALGTLVQAMGADIKGAAKEIYEVESLMTRISSSALGKEPRISGVIGEIKAAF